MSLSSLPVFHVWCPEEGDEEIDGRDIYAESPRLAAQKHVKRLVDGEPVEGAGYVVHARAADGTLTRWSVYVLVRVSYEASMMHDPVNS